MMKASSGSVIWVAVMTSWVLNERVPVRSRVPLEVCGRAAASKAVPSAAPLSWPRQPTHSDSILIFISSPSFCRCLSVLREVCLSVLQAGALYWLVFCMILQAGVLYWLVFLYDPAGRSAILVGLFV